MGKRGKGGPRPPPGPPPSDATLTVGIRQGAGAVTTQPFGNGRQRKQGSSQKRRKGGGRKRQHGQADAKCLDAFAPQHLSLPRAVAPYTVIRTTAIWNPTSADNLRFALFGPMINVGSDAGQWSNGYAISANAGLDFWRSSPNAGYRHTFSAMDTSSWKAASVVPSAFSIQILNPEAIFDSSGMVYIGRCKNKVHLAEGNNDATWRQLAENLVSYSNPRMCSAGKLALRGVQVNAVPNNMSELAKFTSIDQLTDVAFDIEPTNSIHQEGFNPIFIYNPNAVGLQVLVCCEWRVRFDPSNPAYAANDFHKPATEADWSAHIQRALATGSGVMDIVESAARIGTTMGFI